MEQNTNQPSQELNHKMPFKRNKKWVVFIFLILFVVAFIFSLAYLYLNNFKNTPPKGIYAQIGTESITTKEFDEIYNAYLRFDESNLQNGAKVDEKQVERRVADEVLMRLSLQAEAEKRNAQKCTDDAIKERLKERFEDAGGEQLYYDKLSNQYGWTKEVSKHKECLGFYEETLARSLIGSVDLYGIYIRWDIAKGAQNQPADIQQRVDEYAKKRLETEYLPMFERGDTEKQISSKADIDPATVTQEQFDQRVLNIDRSPSRVLILPQMNRATYSEFQQYKEGESELPYFENLKVGENTKPFKSKTGYWVIYRATARTNAPYESLKAMRADYIKKGKVAKSYFGLPELDKPKDDSDPTRNFSLSTLDRIKNALVPTANAVEDDSVQCFTGGTIHNLPMTLKYKDKATGQDIQSSGSYPGPELYSTTNVATPCWDEPAAGSAYGGVIEYYFGAVGIKPSLIPAPTWNFGLSCYTGWDFIFKAPAGYNTLTAADYDDPNRFYLNLQYANSTTSGYYATGIPASSRQDAYRIPPSLYSGIANGAKGFTINVYFTKTAAPTYLGQIQTLKYDNASPALPVPPNGDQQIKNAPTQIYQAGGAVISPCGTFLTCSNTDSSNWATGVVMWVNPSEVTSNDNSTGYLSKIVVPTTNYRVNNAKIIRNNNGNQMNVTPTTTSDGKLLCTGTNNTGTCSIGTKVWNQDTTFVQWFLEKIPQPIPYYPWLQTKNGDVTSADYLGIKGKITGQKIGSATDSNFRRGARRGGTGTAAATVAESSFVVAASDTVGEYFCSQERFVLGRPLADRDNLDYLSCQTGGYTPSPVNFDKVKASIAKAYADNGNGVTKSPATPNACNPKYATGVTAPSGIVFFNSVDNGCPAGGIRKIDGNATIDFEKTNVSGRGTVWVTGDLTINKNIKYSTPTDDPKTTPNLVIFVEGNVFIGADVTQIDASIISMKTISTCSQSTVSTRACENKLVINGFLASGGKIDFARRFYNQATPSPAELINLTGQSTTFPAPGLDRTDIDVTSKLQINGGEFAPRLN